MAGVCLDEVDGGLRIVGRGDFGHRFGGRAARGALAGRASSFFKTFNGWNDGGLCRYWRESAGSARASFRKAREIVVKADEQSSSHNEDGDGQEDDGPLPATRGAYLRRDEINGSSRRL